LNRFAIPIVMGAVLVHIGAQLPLNSESTMEELNGRMLACQILITGLIARVANERPDPLRFLTDFRAKSKPSSKASTSPAWTIPIGSGISRSNRSTSCFADEAAERRLIGAEQEIHAMPDFIGFMHRFRTLTTSFFRTVSN